MADSLRMHPLLGLPAHTGMDKGTVEVHTLVMLAFRLSLCSECASGMQQARMVGVAQ
jgi:hypothetical protein